MWHPSLWHVRKKEGRISFLFCIKQIREGWGAPRVGPSGTLSPPPYLHAKRQNKEMVLHKIVLASFVRVIKLENKEGSSKSWHPL